MKMTIEQLKESVIKEIEWAGCNVESAFEHPDVYEDFMRVAYAEVGQDFDTCNWEMPLQELEEKYEKYIAKVQEMLEAEGFFA